MRYLLSSFVSVGLLFAMLLLPLHTLLSFIGVTGIITILLTLLLIFLFWWFSGSIYDYFFEWRYKADWISYRDLEERHSALSIYLRETLHKHDLSLKKIYLVDDDRPIAITYGPGKSGIRLMLSTGLFRYLDEKEQQAVIAHEIGHMHYGDFSILSTAYLPAFLLYEISHVFWRNGKKHNPLSFVGFIAYLGHLLLSVPVLLQSRIREYFADEFAAEITSPNSLGIALSKISLAYISDAGKKKSTNLMEVIRPFAILDYKMCRNLALAYLYKKENASWLLVEDIVIQDLYNPWPSLYEITTSHPLVGKRLIALCVKAQVQQQTPFLDLERMYGSEILQSTARLNFMEDFLVYSIARFSPLLIALLLLAGYFSHKLLTLGVIIVLYGLGILLLSLYSLSYRNFRQELVKNQLEDKYVSPIKGRPLTLEGVIREKSSLGLDLPEDVIFADHSGDLFIGARSLSPLIFSPYLSTTRLMKLKDQPVKVKGWFLRGKYPKLIIEEVISKHERIKGRQRMFDIGLACLTIAGGLIIIIVA